MAHPTFSFELYPPRSAHAESALLGTLDHLAMLDPEFISVTYGAGGSSRDASLGVLRRLIDDARVTPMAHLTCVGSTMDEARRLVREFLTIGVRNFLALRGDPPQGAPAGTSGLGDLATASELVQLIHRVQEELCPFVQHDIPGFPGAKRLGSGERVTIAVAAFPCGRPPHRSRALELDILLAKEAAGANLAISQLFFHADDFLRFVDDARAAGVTLRILPGLMPILTPSRLRRVSELVQQPIPRDFARRLEAEATPEGQAQVGLDHAIALARDVLVGDRPGLHLYTLNEHRPVTEVLDAVGLLRPDHALRNRPRTTPTREKDHV